MNALPEVTVEEVVLLAKMWGVDLHSSVSLFMPWKQEPASPAEIELVRGMIPRKLVFEYDEGHGRGPSWSLTNIGCDVIRAWESSRKLEAE